MEGQCDLPALSSLNNNAGRGWSYMKEIWKDIEGYEGLYQVSNFGRVRNGIGRLLKPKSNNQYNRISLYKNGRVKDTQIHRVVAETFIPNNDKKKNQVNHIDGNKKNNFVNNLEWVTRSENAKHSVYVLKKNPGNWSRKKVQCIETGEVFKSQIDAAKEYRTSQGAIGNAARGNRPRAGGCHWRFV